MKNSSIIPIVSHLFWICLIGCTVFAVSGQFIEAYLTPKWLAFSIGIVIILLYCAVHLIFGNNVKATQHIELSTISTSICLVLSAQAIYGILQYYGILPQTSGFKASGSYDNPAGFAAVLCSGVPFIMYGITFKSKILKFLHITGIILILFAICLSQSRTGILALITAFALGCNSFITKKRTIKWIIITSLCVFFIIMMALKMDSASGRILIWNNTLKMISDKWLIGWGFGGFEAHYMDFQADFFKNNPGYSKEMMLAGNIQYPFNEYLYILTNHGILGFVVMISYVIILILGYLNNRTTARLAAILAVISVLMLSLFSYPMMFPFVWFSLIYASVIILCDFKIPIGVNTKKYARFCMAGILICISIFAGWKIHERIIAEIKWNAVANNKITNGKLIDEYESLYPILGKDRYFLYNYAHTLYLTGKYDESLKIIDQCSELWADYDVEILTAAIYEKMELYKHADAHYLQAGFMCPNRFKPLYMRFRLFDKIGDTDSAMKCAKAIIDKPVKVSSSEINYIKQDAEKYLL